MNPNYWNDRRQQIRTRIGQWHPGKGVTARGRSMLGELIYEISETQLRVLNITGRLIDKKLAQWLETVSFLTSYPDPRIWCNQIASLAACQGVSPVTGGALSFLAADSRAYGSCLNYLVVGAIEDTYNRYRQQGSFHAVVESYPKRFGSPSIPGFLRPIRVHDERLQPMRRITNELGLCPGRYSEFVQLLSDYLEQHYSCGMNIASYCCALLMDYEFTADQIYVLSVSNVEGGAMACFHDASKEKENGFLPLQCEDINYVGPPERELIL